LDSVQYQEGDRGLAIRAALTARTAVATIPQIFVGGVLVGGSTDVINAWKEGRFQQQLDQARVPYDGAKSNVDPTSFLPGWLHPR
jgi:hypothetical protein